MVSCRNAIEKDHMNHIFIVLRRFTSVLRTPPLGILLLFALLSCHVIVAHTAESRQVKTYTDATITEDTVWRDSVLVRGSVLVAPQATLSIMPGCRVHFDRMSSAQRRLPGLLVAGRLQIAGNEAAPVTLSPSSLNAQTPGWEGITILGSEKNNQIAYAKISGAVTGIKALHSRLTLKNMELDRNGTGMELQNSLLDSRDIRVANSSIGILLQNSETTLQSSILQGNGVGLSARNGTLVMRSCDLLENGKRGMYLLNVRYTIERTLFSGNGIGGAIDGGEGSFRWNSVVKQTGDGLHLANSRAMVRDTTITGNRGAGLTVRDTRAFAFANAFHGNGGADLVNLGTDEFLAPGNWWGGKDPIADKRLSGVGTVNVSPLLTAPPPSP